MEELIGVGCGTPAQKGEEKPLKPQELLVSIVTRLVAGAKPFRRKHLPKVGVNRRRRGAGGRFLRGSAQKRTRFASKISMVVIYDLGLPEGEVPISHCRNACSSNND